MQNPDLVIEFSDSIKSKNHNNISSLLADNGTFQIQDDNLETADVNKEKFLNWFFDILNSTEIRDVDFDACAKCKKGAPVIIFNKGKFPRKPKDDSEKSKTGLMLVVNKNQIQEIRFCFTFLDTDNKCIFETNIERIKHLTASGLTFDQAFEIVCED